MPIATPVIASDTNEDARSTSSTLVNGEINNRNEPDTTTSDEQPQDNNNSTIRHGFDQEIFEEDIIRFLYYSEKRHDTNAKPHPIGRNTLLDWRLRERIKTVSGLLVICLNIGTDPPDIVKTNPCAKLECWIDPFLVIPQKSLETIGKNLHTQYENINSRTRFKLSLDPSVEETKKLCCQTRRNAKEERILFHYNGHGVPKPTSSGEIWVFNRNYTQYIPVSLFDLQSWLGSPVIYVWDCSSAGNIVNAFNRFAEQRDNEALRASQQHQGTLSSSWRDSIQLAACGPTETLPMSPDLPADVFTSCLTTPIEMSLRWVIMRNPLLTTNITMDMVLRLPGCAKERRTPLGELNWIFTAVTDTIAWCVLQGQPELFKRLFRQDLMVASMFRNFLLAERIMRSYQCTPMSTPKLPDTHDHPMWQAWDLAVDMCLFQLPALLAAENGGTPYQYQPSNFFAEQLTAFEVWLSEGAVNPKIPEQLPIVLQVLLSQVHRLRALILLSRFLDLGPWAVNAALSVGIFPYVLKLLQSPAAELKPVLVFIWARILAVDRSCQNDLLKDHGYAYFINILTPNNAMLSIPHVSEHRAMSAFILSVFCTNFKMGQQACLRGNVITACLAHVKDPDPLLRQWVCLCLAQVWMNNSEAKQAAIAENGHEKLCALLNDSVPEVRASVMYALGTFLGDANKTEQMMNIEHNIAIASLVAMSDGSPVVRKEFVVALSHIVHQAGSSKFLVAASQTIDEDQQTQRSINNINTGNGLSTMNGKMKSRPNHRQLSTILAEWRANKESHSGSTSYDSVYAVIWKALLNLSVDPHPDVAKAAAIVVDHINAMLLDTPSVGEYVTSVIRESLQYQASLDPSILSKSNLDSNNNSPSVYHLNEPSSSSATTEVTAASRPAKLTRSVSFASTLRTIYNFGNTSPLNPSEPSNIDNDSPLVSTAHRPDPRSSTTITSANTTTSNHASNLNNGASNNRNNESTSFSNNNDNVLPVSSEFYDWSCEYFTEPQMRAAESDEPGSVVYTQRKWRRSRNEKILLESNSTKAMAGTSRWEDQIISVHNETEATKLLFHQYEPHLVAADAYNCLVVWDWKTGAPLSVIDNHNPSQSRITDMKFINEDDVALLLTGSDDGVIRLYKNYDGSEQEEAILVSSWRALKDMEKSNSRQSGLVCEWHQGRGALFTGGDARVIKVWDAHQEMSVMDIATQSDGCVTSITSDQTSGNILIAGFGDGLIGVYDRRLKNSSSMVQRWDEHNAWVTGVHLQRDGNRELVSGGFGGDIKIWDIRQTHSIRTIEAHTHADMTSLAVHDHSQVIVSAGDDQVIKFWNVDGTRLSTLRPSTGFLGQKSSFTRALTFHPNLMVVAASSDDGYITLYGTQ
ncbi:raptor N-terminal caspase like domain-containing protein [Halteromyces radiatus]|uniref:raptor N-terminal caspase like domain-containing protein n=1 Tax=Halteromyces radiatus TaxID=101107 RepID=UPI002220A0B1|nr:raptor N-terminal caspase like domain-containing protein [Halteromyces radiatus]KAI8086100.1 raptor N-terminal caspase like domain-containing protein [Halteromyces radiatus]